MTLRFLASAAATIAVVSQTAFATPVAADTIQRDWQEAINSWAKLARDANTRELRTAAADEQPDPAAYAEKMWQCISPSLSQEWTLDPAAWLLVMIKDLPSQPGSSQAVWPQRMDTIKKAVGAHHVESPNLNTICMALAQLGDPLSLSILEKIDQSNPDPSVQGVAALAASMVIKNLGDDSELMRKRLTYLRKAIIESADVKIGQTTVAEIAESELYQIRFLSKGRVAPNLEGTDSAGRRLSLDSFRDKVVILVFWSSTIPQAGQTIEITRELVTKFDGKPVAIVGINHDPLEKLRSMVADKSVTWKNFSDPDKELAATYRINNWPVAFVLDAQRRIQYAGALGTFAELTAEALASEMR